MRLCRIFCVWPHETREQCARHEAHTFDAAATGGSSLSLCFRSRIVAVQLGFVPSAPSVGISGRAFDETVTCRRCYRLCRLRLGATVGD